MKLFVVLCLASVALASPQGYGYSAPTVVSERTYTIRPQLQGGEASFGGASYGGASYGSGSYGAASYGDASYGGASYGASSGGSYGRSLGGFSAATPVQVQQRSYQLQASSAAPAYQAQSSGYYGGASQNGAAEQGGSYVVNFGVNSGRTLNLAGLSGGYASGYSGYSAAAPVARAYSGAEAVHSAASEHIDLASQPQGETKIFKHVYAFSGPEEPAQRARVVVKAPVSNSKHFKLVFIKAPTSGAIVDSDITLPAQEEEKTQIYVLSKQQHHQPTIRVHTAQAAKHNKPEVLFVKYRNEAEAQAIASGAISGQASGIPAGGQIVSDGSISVGGSGNYGGYSGNSGNSGYSGYSGASFGSGAGLGVASGRSLIVSNGANSGSGLTSFRYGSGSGIGSSSGFGSGATFGTSSGYGSGATFGTSSGYGSGAGFGSSTGFGSGFGSGTGFGTRSLYGSRSTYSRNF